MSKTPHYQLQQQIPGEVPNHSVLNENLTKLDTAIHAVKTAGETDRSAIRGELGTQVQKLQKTLTELDSAKCRIYTGSYSGNNAETRRITLGFRPEAVFLTTPYGWKGNNGLVYGGLAIYGHRAEANGKLVLEVAWDGFDVGFYAAQDAYGNCSDIRYFYVAFA